MLGGPVCHFEMIRLARKRGHFALRLVFGLILLIVLGFNYLVMVDGPAWWFGGGQRRAYTIQEMARFGESVFGSILLAQFVLVLGLTPALVADAIASERQRKTLHYLLTSRLRGSEIVLGKLLARLLTVGVFLAITLPIASLLTLVGGVDPEVLVLAYASMAAMAYFVASLAIWASAASRRPREAVGLAYALTFLWLFGPSLLAGLAYLLPEPWGSKVGGALDAAFRWAWPSSPLNFVGQVGSLVAGQRDVLRSYVAWMIGTLAVYGTLFVAVSAWRLRPWFRRHEGRGERKSRSVARRVFPKPPCGDDPVYWREAFVVGSGGGWGRVFVRAIGLVIGVAIVGGGIYYSAFAFQELVKFGYLYGDPAPYESRMAFNLYLRFAATGLFGLWLLNLAGLTGASIASEREADTWISLLSTPLDGPEVLRGKILGALRATWMPGVAVVGLWMLGLIAGAVHPLGLVLALGKAAMFVWFTVALGTYCSLKAKTAWRAQTTTQGILILPHVCCLMPIPSVLMMLGYSLLSYSEINAVLNNHRSVFDDWWFGGLILGYYVLGIALYAGSAYGLTMGCLRGFDAAADRPGSGPSGRRFARGTAAKDVFVAEPDGDELV